MNKTYKGKWTKARRKAHGEKIRDVLTNKKLAARIADNALKVKAVQKAEAEARMERHVSEWTKNPATWTNVQYTYNDVMDNALGRIASIESRLLLLEKLNGFGKLLRKCGLI